MLGGDAGEREADVKGGLTRRMVVASGLLALIVAAAFVLVFFAITNLRETTDLRRRTREAQDAADVLATLVINLETGLRGFVITGAERFLQPWNHARSAFPKQAATLERLVADDPGQLSRVRRIVQAATSYIEEYSLPLIDAVRRNDPSARSVARTQEGKRRIDALRSEFDAFEAAERAVLAPREANDAAAANRALVAAGVGVVGSILLILLFSGYLTREIVRPVRRVALMAGRLAGGDLGTRMPENSAGEIGTLERSFNTMAMSLEEGARRPRPARRRAGRVAARCDARGEGSVTERRLRRGRRGSRPGSSGRSRAHCSVHARRNRDHRRKLERTR
jgi:CHASE3 domain sensor protein